MTWVSSQSSQIEDHNFSQLDFHSSTKDTSSCFLVFYAFWPTFQKNPSAQVIKGHSLKTKSVANSCSMMCLKWIILNQVGKECPEVSVCEKYFSCRQELPQTRENSIKWLKYEETLQLVLDEAISASHYTPNGSPLKSAKFMTIKSCNSAWLFARSENFNTFWWHCWTPQIGCVGSSMVDRCVQDSNNY